MRRMQRICIALFAISVIAIISTAVAFGQATVTTDKTDYSPWDTVVVTGSGWQPGETVQLVFDENPYIHPPDTLYTAADSSGNIYNNAYIIQDHDLGQTFTLTATGQSSGLTAQTTFTDAASYTLGSNSVSAANV